MLLKGNQGVVTFIENGVGVRNGLTIASFVRMQQGHASLNATAGNERDMKVVGVWQKDGYISRERMKIDEAQGL